MTIEAFKITVGYDPGRPILADESISIKQGKVNVIIGKNGCGKSTMLKSLCRQLKVAKGIVKLNEIDIGDLTIKAFAKKVGILFQENTVPREMKVRDLISYGRFAQIGIFSKMKEEDDKKIEEAMTLTGTKEFESMQVGSLSSGQRQLVWIAMLIAQEADFLFLDEPTTYLDLKNQFEILNCLKKLNAEKKKTIVMILHDINIAAQYADYIFAMKDGRVIKEGTVDEVISEEFLASLYDVKIEVIERGSRLCCIPLSTQS